MKVVQLINLIKKNLEKFFKEYRAYCLKISDYVRFITDFYSVLLSNGFNELKLWDGIKNQGLKLKEWFYVNWLLCKFRRLYSNKFKTCLYIKVIGDKGYRRNLHFY